MAPRDRQCPPLGPPPWSRAPLARGCELHPDSRVSPGLPNFTVSQRGPGDLPLSQAGPWEPPKTTLPIPAASLGRQQRSRLSSPGPAGQDHRNARLCSTGTPGRKAGTELPGSDRQQGAAHPSQTIAAGSCPPKKLVSRQAGARGEPPRTAGTGSPVLWWGDVTDSNSWYLPCPRLRFHSVSSDLSTGCHQMSHPVPM